MVDIFRNSAWAGAIMDDDAFEQFIPVIWTQLGVVDDATHTLRQGERCRRDFCLQATSLRRESSLETPGNLIDGLESLHTQHTGYV
jgi:predicted CoA-binding protein